MPRIRVSALGLTQGQASDLPSNQLNILQSPTLKNVQVRRSFMRPRFGLAAFADRPNNDPVTGLFSARLETAGTELYRIKASSTAGNAAEIRRLSGNAWVAITNGSGLSGGDTDPWSTDVVLSKPVFVNGVNANLYHDIAGAQLVALGGIKSRYVIQYNGRTFLAYQDPGTPVVNQVQSSAPGTFNDFASLGSVQTQLRDDPFPITGLSVNRRFTVYKERSIVVGAPTGQFQQPVRYETINTGGVGLWAPGAIAKLGVLDVFLASDDFYTFDATGTPRALDAPIRQTLLQGINPSALRQCHAVHATDDGEVIFFISMGGDRFPRDAWVWNYRLNAWWHWQFAGQLGASVAHALSLSDTWDSQPVGASWDSDVGTWSDLDGVAAKQAIIVGEAGESLAAPGYGRTLRFDSATRIDAFNTPTGVTWYYDLPDIDLEGIAIDENRQPIRSIRAKDWKTLDRIDLVYQDISIVSITAQVSTNEGMSYTTFDTKTTEGTGGVKLLSFWGRQAGQRIRLRISGSSPDFAIRDIVMYLSLTGAGK